MTAVSLKLLSRDVRSTKDPGFMRFRTRSYRTANFVKNSKYYDVNNVIPMGQYRCDYISLYKNEIVPEEISKAKNSGKKILIVFGNFYTHYFY